MLLVSIVVSMEINRRH